MNIHNLSSSELSLGFSECENSSVQQWNHNSRIAFCKNLDLIFFYITCSPNSANFCMLSVIQVSGFLLACVLTTECAIPPFNGDSMILAGVHIDLNYVTESRFHTIILAHIIDADLYEVIRVD